MELVRILANLDNLVGNNRMGLIHLKEAMSYFPENFLREVTKVYNFVSIKKEGD